MRRIILMAAMAIVGGKAMAGGLMTNTNYHIAFDRMMARGASFDIDAAYSNPAGLAWGHEGLQLSLNFQKPWQNRDITTDIPNFPTAGEDYHYTYKGKASAPIVPAIFAAYKKDRFNISYMLGIVGSGGAVKYDDGVPMFSIPVKAMLQPMVTSQMIPGYTLDTQLKGKQYIYGSQLNFGYKFTDNFSAAVGIRANYYDGSYKGNVTANAGTINLVDLQLDCTQRGWGFTPIVSVDFHKGPLTLAARYEFRTKLETKNDTKTLSVGSMGNKIAGYMDKAKTRYDMPSLLSFAAGYEFTDKFRATVEYHFFDDKNAKMAGDRQKTLKGGTNEYQLGLEYDINEKFTISCGGQRTDYGLSDEYQQNTSFACDSYSVGLGAAINLTDKIRVNAGYFITLYEDYKKTPDYYPVAGATETYSRTNNVIGIGIDYKF